jgi:glucosyl-dolichyl phosphate glucuronosyltransferase
LSCELHSPYLSVLICTYNNADSLDLTLQQLYRQDYGQEFTVEFLIVDNNSSDHTAKTVAFYCELDGRFNYIHEPKQGLSHARNTGVEHAKGQYVLFTDDDAQLPANWIQEYLGVLTLNRPDCCFSTIAVIWQNPKPWWYCPGFRAQFVELNYGDDIIAIKDIHHEFFGKNFCLLRQEIIEQGGFDPKLGRLGGRLIAGEETVIYRRLIHRNKNVIYFPSAPVGHRLKDKEYTVEHITRAYLDGAYTSYNVGLNFSTRQLFGRPLGVLVAALRAAAVSLVGWLQCAVKVDRPMSFYYKLAFVRAVHTVVVWVRKP